MQMHNCTVIDSSDLHFKQLLSLSNLSALRSYKCLMFSIQFQSCSTLLTNFFFQRTESNFILIQKTVLTLSVIVMIINKDDSHSLSIVLNVL